jgi:tyrosyl-tRNA synthetase
MRPQLTEAEVREHARTYMEQFHRVVPERPDPPQLPVEVRHNGEWFSRMAFMDVMKLASEYTVARMLERDDFSKRFKAGHPISIHELFYPLMQGYDSVAIRADVELGGTEQKFNLARGARSAGAARTATPSDHDAADPSRTRRRAADEQEHWKLYRRFRACGRGLRQGHASS